MKKQINLIPNELAVSPKYVKLAKEINKVSVFGMSIFVFFLVLFLVFYFYYSNLFKKTNSELTRLKTNISSLEDSEQRLVLVKDRLSKIRQVKKLNTIEKDIANAKIILDQLGQIENQNQTSISLKDQQTDLVFKSSSTSLLAESLRVVSSLGLYNTILVQSIALIPDSGYTVNINLTNE